MAQGLVTRQKLIDARASSADKLYLKTDNKIIQNKVLNIKDQFKKFNITEKEYQDQIVKIKNEIATVDKINKTLTDVNKDGLALNAGPIEESWFLGIKDGSLTKGSSVKIHTSDPEYNLGTMYYDTFFEYNEDGNLTGMSPKGTMVPIDELLAIAEQMPTRALKKEFDLKMSSWQKANFPEGTEARWGAASVEFVTTMANKIFAQGKNKNTMYTSLIDNNLGFDLTNSKNETKNFNWHDWYLDPKNKALTVEQRAKYDEVLGGYDEEVRERAKGIVLSQIMEGDKGLIDDVKRYLTEITEYKKPVAKQETPDYILGSEFDPSPYNVPDYNINRLLTLFKEGEDGTELGDLEVYRQDMGGGKIQLKRKNKQGEAEKDEVLGFSFNPKSPEEVTKMLPYIQRLLFGSASKQELLAMENFKAYLANNPGILTK